MEKFVDIPTFCYNSFMLTKHNKKIQRIGIDARFYGPIGKGLGRYTQEIVDNLIKIDTTNEYVIFLYKENFQEFDCDGVRIKKVLLNIRWYTLAEQILFPFYIWREKLDLMFFPHFNVPILTPKKYIITIHDLILTKFPTVRATTLSPWLYRIKDLAYRITIRLAVWRAKKIIAVSEYTKKDLIDNFRLDEKKITVTYEGVANLSKNRDSLFAEKLNNNQVLEKYKISKPFLMYVGNSYPHKNLDGLVDIFPEILRQYPDMKLILVGKEDYFYARIKKYTESKGLYQKDDNNSKIIFPDYVPDKDLEILFKNAVAYVFPSKYEGFGLPPMEAMAKGCPVVSSNASCLPEILGEAAIYFDPENKNEMIAQINKIITDENLRAELIKKGYEQAKKYNWWECARLTLGVIDEAFMT